MAPLTGAAEAAVQGFFRGRRGTRVLRPAHGSFERRTASLDCVPRYPHECVPRVLCVVSVCSHVRRLRGAAVCVYCPAALVCGVYVSRGACAASRPARPPCGEWRRASTGSAMRRARCDRRGVRPEKPPCN